MTTDGDDRLETERHGAAAPRAPAGPVMARRPQPGELDIISHSEEQTRRLGARLGTLLEPGDVLLVTGNLGAGKTVFAQGVAAGLGVTDPVTSPSFILIHDYKGRLPFYHVDLYRIQSEAEAEALGLEEYLYGDGVTLIEWAERIPGLAPASHLAVELRPLTETKRAIRLVARGERYARLLADFKRAAFGL
jgi:tRNA threonylcarbamoyladenosine biosynthesis protein TsaE